MAIVGRLKPAVLSPDLLGSSFVFRMAEILGPEYANDRKPPYEGQELTVVGFRPRLKNNVIVRDTSGNCSLMPLFMAEKALSLESLQIEIDQAHSGLRRSPEWGNVRTSVRHRPEAVERLIESCRCSPAEQRHASKKALRARPAQRGGRQNGR